MGSNLTSHDVAIFMIWITPICVFAMSWEAEYERGRNIPRYYFTRLLFGRWLEFTLHPFRFTVHSLHEDDVCPVCRETHSLGTAFACRHFYCWECIYALHKHKMTKCQLCQRPWEYGPPAVLHCLPNMCSVVLRSTLALGALQSTMQPLIWLFSTCVKDDIRNDIRRLCQFSNSTTCAETLVEYNKPVNCVYGLLYITAYALIAHLHYRIREVNRTPPPKVAMLMVMVADLAFSGLHFFLLIDSLETFCAFVANITSRWIVIRA